MVNPWGTSKLIRDVRPVLAMIENATNDNPDREEERGAFLQAAVKIVSGMAKVVFALVPFAALAAVVGWIQARAYYSQFGAAWLVSKLSTTDLLTFSWLPLAMLAVFLWAGVMDLEDGGESRRKHTLWIMRYSWIFVLVLIAISVVLTKFDLPTLSAIVSINFAIAYALFAGAAFESLVLSLRYGTFRWDKSITRLIFGSILFGFYVVPHQIGITRAQRDLHPEKSGLPAVVVRERPEEKYRFLLSSGGKAYAVRFDQKSGAYPKIFVLDLGDVEYIQRCSGKAKDAGK